MIVDQARLSGPQHTASAERPNARAVLVNSAWLMGAELVTRLLSFATILYLSRTLAAHDMGLVEFGQAVFAFVQLIALSGVEAHLAPEMVRHPESATRLAGRGIALTWTVLAIVLAAGLVAPLVVDVRRDLWTSALVFGGAAALTPLAVRFAFIATERFSPLAIGLMASQLAFLILCFALVRLPDGALRAGACWAIAIAIRAAIPGLRFLRTWGTPVFDLRRLGADLVTIVPVGLGGIARGLMLTIDVLVVGLLCAPADVARYGLATKLPLFVASLATIVHLTLFPSIARATTAGDVVRLGRLERTVLPGWLGFAIPGAICLGSVAAPLMTALFTERFRDAWPILALLVWRLPLAGAAGFYRTLVWAKSSRIDARIAVSVLVTTVAVQGVAAAWLGLAGAAIGMLAGDALALVLHARNAPRRGLDRSAWLRVAAGVAIAAGGMLVVPRPPGAASVVVALAVWAVAALPAARPAVRHLLAVRRERA